MHRGALQHDVRRLQIAMDDPFLVRRLERLGDLPRNRERLGDRQRPAREAIGKGRALDQFEDQRRHAIDFFESVDRADVRMIERGEEAGFAREAGTTLGVRCEVRRQDLDGDVAPQLAVARAIDLAHAARAERRHDRVRPELTAHHRGLFGAPRGRRNHDRRGCFEKPRRRRLVAEQRLDFLPQRLIPLARLFQERAALPGRTRQRRMVEVGDPVASIPWSSGDGTSQSRKHSWSRLVGPQGCWAESSRINQFFANFQSLITVSGEIFSTSAVSSTLNPPKKRSSTTWLFRSYCAASDRSASSMAIRSSGVSLVTSRS